MQKSRVINLVSSSYCSLLWLPAALLENLLCQGPILRMGLHQLRHLSNEQRTLIVFAASSLTDAFLEVSRDFEASNPGVKVILNLAGSQALRTQLEQGALADIFASANIERDEYSASLKA